MVVSNAFIYKETTRQQWQNAAAAWQRWDSTLRAWFTPATELMLDLARVADGSRVLDVAAGAGEPAISAAMRVGGKGRVVAIDISSNMLALTEQSAAARGLGGIVETCVLDGENLELPDGSFDAVLSRLGLIYFPDRRRGLAEMRRVLRAGGRVAIAAFSTPERNEIMSIPTSIIRARARLPQPGPEQPGPFSMGAAGVMERELSDAGLQEVEVRAVVCTARLASAAECTRFAREAFGALHQMMASLPTAEREQVWIEIGTALRKFEGPDGFEAPCELLVGAGTR